jgi:hypothetical protein
MGLADVIGQLRAEMEQAIKDGENPAAAEEVAQAA